MNYNDVKKSINKLNARLKKLRDISPNSYEFAIAQLKQISGIEFTKGGYIRVSQKTLSHPHLDKLIGSAENSVPTVSSEIDYIKHELSFIDQRRKNKYGTAIPKRDKSELLTELKAKRHFDVRALKKDTVFEESYEEPLFMTEELIELENEINRRLGKDKKGIKSYAELYEMQQLIEEYFEEIS